MAYDSECTAGFTIFPHIVAIVHTDPYVDLYHYYRRRTLAKVPRHFSFFYIFLANRSYAIFTNIHHGRRWPWPLYRRPRPEDAQSGATRLFPTSWATPHLLGSIKFIEGGEIYITTHQGDLRGLSLPQHGATDIASTAAHGQKTPVPEQRA